ncbi:GDP-fucose synthetase [Hahella sp. CCB-MM4]|uniref:GDP-L-fucose synthase family protein n=1 Tax=Hahella sp. (strain CCB-MM4) TaxID=1926491 RepID=UPI000B9A80F0|nr:GDP-L-fucose synthase [Hahella sp. CCB-MM4]OZG74860.1 GDP-fucose synthetase [Hahella sp. CCB-MM4]
MDKSASIFVAGHNGMVGASILSLLKSNGFNNIHSIDRNSLDLKDQKAVAEYFAENRFQYVFLAAAKVGGIYANNAYPADFIYDNLAIQCNVIHSSYCTGVERLLFLGSSCIYPREAEQPMRENALLTGVLEPTNEPYAIAKIAGIKMCESYNRQYGTDYRSVMPTNLYGPNDNFHPENSHVVPALIGRFHHAKENQLAKVSIWGTGRALREFLHVEDMASACLHVMSIPKESYRGITEPQLSHINVGTGVDCSIAELAHTISEVIGYEGEVDFDTTKPDGAPRKLMDSCKLRQLGWSPKYDLKSGLEHAYRWYLENVVE